MLRLSKAQVGKSSRLLARGWVLEARMDLGDAEPVASAFG
jgi:hypothetical protein